MNIDEMVDRAKEYSGCKSDRELARKLGISQTAINYYRTKRSWPSEDYIIRIAHLARIDPAEAVVMLNIWRAKGPELEVYQKILSRLRQTAAALLVALAVGVAGQGYVSEVQANTGFERPGQSHSTVYYGKYWIMFWEAILFEL